MRRGAAIIGWGDEIIITGQARQFREAGQGRTIVYDRNGSIREHAAWANNPSIITRSERVPIKYARVDNGPGLRPYIHAKKDDRWIWKEWECPVGELRFSEPEIAFARPHKGYMVIEPNTKGKASPNKDWGRANWVQLVHLLKRQGVLPVQLGAGGTQIIPGASFCETLTLRFACAVLANARAAILPEGGLHHSAAALRVKSIVIFGGYISPKQTGYATQVNLFTGGEPCGKRMSCEHCKKAMAAITPEEVMSKLEVLLNGPV